MRLSLLLRPTELFGRAAVRLNNRRRLRRLRGTVARDLLVAHIESLELLDAVKPLGIEVIYDVGANVGTWAVLAKAMFPTASVEAFEPLRQHEEGFHRLVGSLPGVNLHAIALGSENTSAMMRVTAFSDASSLLRATDVSRTKFGTTEVGTAPTIVRRLDDYREEHGIPLPDLIKLDVQGYELEVLRAAPKCLSAAKAVIVEVSFAEYYEGQCAFHDLVALLARSGFFLSVLSVHTPVGSPLQQTDALFVKSQVHANRRPEMSVA